MNLLPNIVSSWPEPRSCPFCGAPPQRLFTHIKQSEPPMMRIRCLECDAYGPPVETSGHIGVCGTDEKKALTRWNGTNENAPKVEEDWAWQYDQ